MFSFWIRWPYHPIFFNTQITLQEGGQTANEELQVTKFGVGFKALSALQQENDLSREEFKF